VFALEKRGYVKAGPSTPEASVEHPEAGIYLIFLKVAVRLIHNLYLNVSRSNCTIITLHQ
jgi:hypothetical protein